MRIIYSGLKCGANSAVKTGMKKCLEDLSILLVDDELDLLSITQERLSIDGALVQTAQDGVDALKLFNSNHFDIVVSDIHMPNMDGKALIKEIRKINQDIPIICMTGFTDFTDNEVLSWGANQNFRKPLPISDLIEKVLSFTGQNSQKKTEKNQAS